MPAELESGEPIPPSVLARLACDSEISRVVFGPEGQVLDVGRAERTYSRQLRRAIIAPTATAPTPGAVRPRRSARCTTSAGGSTAARRRSRTGSSCAGTTTGRCTGVVCGSAGSAAAGGSRRRTALPSTRLDLGAALRCSTSRPELRPAIAAGRTHLLQHPALRRAPILRRPLLRGRSPRGLTARGAARPERGIRSVGTRQRPGPRLVSSRCPREARPSRMSPGTGPTRRRAPRGPAHRRPSPVVPPVRTPARAQHTCAPHDAGRARPLAARGGSHVSSSPRSSAASAHRRELGAARPRPHQGR